MLEGFQRLLESTTARQAVATRLVWRVTQSLDEDLARELHGALEEALAWMVAGGAARVMVRVAFEDSQLAVECVEELGRGLVSDASALLSRLRRRMALYDGRVEVAARVPRGTRLRISVPCRAA